MDRNLRDDLHRLVLRRKQAEQGSQFHVGHLSEELLLHDVPCYPRGSLVHHPHTPDHYPGSVPHHIRPSVLWRNPIPQLGSWYWILPGSVSSGPISHLGIFLDTLLHVSSGQKSEFCLVLFPHLTPSLLSAYRRDETNGRLGTGRQDTEEIMAGETKTET